MTYFEENNNLIIKNIPDFDPTQTLECGQCFRWNNISDNEYTGVALGKPVKISISDSNVVMHNVSMLDFKNVWLDYFDLSFDYQTIKTDLSNLNSTLKKATEFSPGIRILNQDPWEALCSFIISQNNNIPRIKLIISKFCENFGRQLTESDFDFPSFDLVASLTEADLIPIKSGFRAKYIIDAAKKVNSNVIDFKKLKSMPIEDARKTLMQINGVGPKVAECTLLYGLHRLEAFPLDVWMNRAMNVLFPGKTPDYFGAYAGVAQQYIFHYSRMNPLLFK